MASRADIQQLVIPENLQKVLSRIADIEERSMSGSVRVMITRRAKELGIVVDEQEQMEPEIVHA